MLGKFYEGEISSLEICPQIVQMTKWSSEYVKSIPFPHQSPPTLYLTLTLPAFVTIPGPPSWRPCPDRDLHRRPLQRIRGRRQVRGDRRLPWGQALPPSPTPTQVPPRSPTKARMKKAANLEIPTSVIISITSSLLLTKEALTKNYLLLKYKDIFKKIYTYIIYFN